MAVIVSATKTVSFKSPYTGATFQRLSGLLMGQDGYISGGATSDDGVTVTVAPVTILQRGVAAQSLVSAAGIAVPAVPEPWFVLAAIPDDDPDSGVSFAVTADLGTAAQSVIVAFKSNGVWVNPVGVDVRAAGERDSDSGGEEDLGISDLRSTAGVITSMRAFKGLVVDPSGKRRVLRTPAGNSARILNQTPVRPNSVFDRNDHVVLRQLEPFSPEVKTIIGGALRPNPGLLTLDAGAGVSRPSYYAKRGGAPGEQWWAIGNGINLKIKGGPAGEAFALTTLLSGGTITSTLIVGQRASDSAVLLLYVDGLNLRLVSFHPTTGAVVNGAVTLESLAGQISHVRAVLDRSEKLHITFDHDEGPHKQVYYTKRGVLTGGSFGVSEVAPKIINGVDTGSNDTWPSIGVDRHGMVTVAHIRGTGLNEFGNMVVASIDQSGNTVSQDLIFAASDVGVDGGPLSGNGYPGVGASFLAFLNVRRTSVVVTPHDEVYVFTIGLSAGVLPDYLLAHSPSFKRDHGFKLINVAPKVAVAGYGIAALDAEAGESGEIFLAHKRENTGLPRTRIIHHTFSTPLIKDGKVPSPIWGEEQFEDVASVDSFQDLVVRRGPLGEFVVNYMITTSAKAAQRAPLSDGVSIIGGVTAIPGPPQRHPKDVYLGTWSVPKVLSATLDGHSKRLEVFSARPKKMNYPILVGQNGDFQGFGSLAEAVAQTDKNGGGEIILRPGVHRLLSALTLRSGVSIRGEGAASIIADAAGAVGGGGRPITTVTISGNVLTDTGGLFDLAEARSGDVIDMATSGRHVVVRNLGPHPISGEPRVLVENSAAGVPVGATAHLHASGIRLENLTILQTALSFITVGIFYAYRPMLRNIAIEGPTSNAIILQNCIEALVDGVDLTRVVNTDADTSMYLDICTGPMIRGAKFADGKGRLHIEDTSQDVHLVGCSSDGANSTKVIYDILGTRTTPVFMSSCEGRVSGSPASLAFLITNVGRRIRQPEGGGQLEFEDDNTRASTIVDDGIKLSSVSQKEFNSVTKDVITGAVNERVKILDEARIKTLGAPLLSTEADSLIPRITADYSVVAGVDFTLMWESAQQGLTTGTYTQPVTRIYTSNTGQMVFTSNAIWGGVTWTKDVAGQNATKHSVSKDGLRTYTRVSDVAWNDTAWADTFRLTNPLETAADARVPRLSMAGFDGAAITEFTLLSSISFTGYTLRLYAVHLTDTVVFTLTFNAQWNGANWVKDTAGKVSTRFYSSMLGSTPVDSSRLYTYHQVCLTTDTFPESDWYATPTTASLPNSGGTFVTGRVHSGAMGSNNINPQARFAAVPEGFGDGSTSSTFFVDPLDSIDTPNAMVDTYGLPDSHGGVIYEEFWYNGLPPGWSALTSGAGVVNSNFNGVSRLRLNPGAVDAAGIRTDATVVQAAYSSFHAELLWPNVLGKTSFGYTDVAANQYMGFLQDSALFGDENIRVALRTGAGLQVQDTGVSLTPLVNGWVKFRAFARGGSGLLTTTSLFWSIQSKKGNANGVFTPGGSILNPTVGVYYRFDAALGAFLVIERMAMGGHNNFAL